MTRDRIIQALYRGGQAAIAAELVSLFGVLIMMLVDRDLIFSQIDSSSFISRQNFVEAIYDHHLFYSTGVLLVSAAPAVGMLFVVWAWHLYFASEGIQIMHWMATSVGLAGFVTRTLFALLDIVLLQDIAIALHEGSIAYSEAYGTLALIGSLYIVSIAISFGLYPMALLMASWQKRLLPLWFMIPAFIFAFINDLNLLYGTQFPFLTNLAGGITILWPFLFGVVMLRKAQKLATELYIEKHGTPPPAAPTLFSGRTPSTH